MKSMPVLAVWVASATAAVGMAASAYAGGPPNVPTVPNVPSSTSYQFQSPGGNIACNLGPGTSSVAGVACDIGDHTYTPPPTPADCHLGWGDRFSLQQGNAAMMNCHGDTLRVPGLATLDYGQTRTVGSITCDSESAGMTCTDSSTGHYFRVSSGSYQMG